MVRYTILRKNYGWHSPRTDFKKGEVMHQLLKSWKESLFLFKPVNLKPLLIETFRYAYTTYALLFRYFWWLMLICVVLAYYFPYPVHTYYHAHPFYENVPNYLINWLVEFFFVFIVFLAARPSKDKKDSAYFLR